MWPMAFGMVIFLADNAFEKRLVVVRALGATSTTGGHESVLYRRSTPI